MALRHSGLSLGATGISYLESGDWVGAFSYRWLQSDHHFRGDEDEGPVRSLKLGHPLTQGTTDSNELWADVKVTDAQGRVLGRSGGLGPHNEVDPCSHFVNIYMLDRHGNRIDRRTRRIFSRPSTTTRFRPVPPPSSTTDSPCRKVKPVSSPSR